MPFFTYFSNLPIKVPTGCKCVDKILLRPNSLPKKFRKDLDSGTTSTLEPRRRKANRPLEQTPFSKLMFDSPVELANPSVH